MKRTEEIRNEINDCRKEIIELMKLSKTEMISAIAKSAKAKHYTIDDEKDYGLILKVELNSGEHVIVAFNPGRKTPYKPCPMTGKATAKDLENYVWIPVICERENNKGTFGYRIDFMCQDLDVKTSNFHFNLFGGLQIWRNLIQKDSIEIGGSINPKPEPEKMAKYYIVEYGIQNAYPSCIRQNRNEKNEPWGYHFDRVPSFDMLDENFDMQECANFILELIIKDLEDKIL